MKRRDFLLSSIKGLVGIILTGCAADNFVSTNENLIQIQREMITFKYNLTKEIQEIKFPTKKGFEKSIAQKIEKDSDEILPFILRNNKNRDFYFQKVKTPQGEFAKEILIYNPYYGGFNLSNITPETLLSEGIFPIINKRDLEKDITIVPSKHKIKDIFEENYLFQEVAFCYENEQLKTNFYLIPFKNMTVKRLKPFGNPLIQSPSGIFRGFSLNDSNFDINEKPYKLQLY